MLEFKRKKKIPASEQNAQALKESVKKKYEIEIISITEISRKELDNMLKDIIELRNSDSASQ